jgi:hypothetical protein
MINHALAKHYRIAQGYIKMLVKAGVIDVDRVDTLENPADTYTKALARAAFEKHRATIMGPQESPAAK